MERREAFRLTATLIGYGLSGTLVSGFLNSCKLDSVPEWKPVFFSKEQATNMAELAEHLLPRTDTPGAKDVGVDRFLDQFISSCFDEKRQKEFLNGFDAFLGNCQERFGHSFIDCSKEERDLVFEEGEKQPYEPAIHLWGNEIKGEGEVSFYRRLKGLVLFAYFSSEQIGEKVLNYDPVPGRQVGCASLKELGKSWSL